MSTEPPAALENDLGWLIGQVFHAYLTGAQQVLEDFPSGQRGYLTLSIAAGGGARNQQELARQVGCDRTVMVYLIDNLVKEGLVERRPDPADRRNRLIVPTGHGLERLTAARAELAKVTEHLLAPLEPADRARLLDSLRTLARHHGSGGEACRKLAPAEGGSGVC